ncbi:MAG TPA: hypothetical protein VK694_00195 [Verrucomicrobiae bacterium]|nr:hypothetical protein [Verrucomicrobiae bacterium]
MFIRQADYHEVELVEPQTNETPVDPTDDEPTQADAPGEDAWDVDQVVQFAQQTFGGNPPQDVRELVDSKPKGKLPTSEEAITYATALALKLPVTLLEAMVLEKLWNWFVPSVFPSASPTISRAQARGLRLVIKLLSPPGEFDVSLLRPSKPTPSVARIVLTNGFRLSLAATTLAFGAVAKRKLDQSAR